MAKTEKAPQVVQCVAVHEWNTTDRQGKPITKLIGTFSLDGKEFEVFETKHFKPEVNSYYSASLYVYNSAYVSKKDGKAYTRSNVGINWEKLY